MSLHHVGMGSVQYLQKQQTPYRWHQWVVLTVAHGLLGLEWVTWCWWLALWTWRPSPPGPVEYAPGEALAMQQASAPARKAKWKKALWLSVVRRPTSPPKYIPVQVTTRSTWNRLKEGKRKEKTDERNLWPHRISGFTHSLSGLSAQEKCGVAGCSVTARPGVARSAGLTSFQIRSLKVDSINQRAFPSPFSGSTNNSTLHFFPFFAPLNPLFHTPFLASDS